MAWSIKEMMQPVITRLFIYGMNPIDLERVFKELDKTPLFNTRTLEAKWIELWSEKAGQFKKLAEIAEKEGHLESAKAFREYITHCDYAQFLINSDYIDLKKEVYEKFETDYEIYTKYLTGSIKKVSIPFNAEQNLAGYLHLPKEERSKYPCMILFAGEGSCKEELNTLARVFVARGIAVLAWDAPGTGRSLFKEDIKTSANNLQQSFKLVFEWVKAQDFIDENNIGCCGLCMGGGYAYFAAAHEKNVKCCINLFPLFITQTNIEKIPHWMKNSKWANYQRALTGDALMADMKALEAGSVSCYYLIVAGKHDNWMNYDTAMALYEKTTGPKEVITIDEAPAFSDGESMLHTMPVGEQMHWLKHVVADWALTKFNSKI